MNASPLSPAKNSGPAKNDEPREDATVDARPEDATDDAVAPPEAVQAPPPAKPKAAPPAAPEAGAAPGEQSRSNIYENTIRVDVQLLDSLMNLVGELVLTRNQILQSKSSQSDRALAASSQQLNLITAELQEGIMKTRMQPIGNIWNKFPRVVRDLVVACEKEARVEMEGADTELDKTIIEAIKDPLTHLVRNAIDHGIEKPADRIAGGKSAEGRLLLRAYHEGGQVNIEIIDNGGGIQTERIKQKALERGVITQPDAARMSEREILHLIFTPGFSTAETVSNISGRGVGMDVVRTNIEKLGGTIDVNSKLGQGTTFKIKIPLTLAIIPALIVKMQEAKFAIPQVNLLELVRLVLAPLVLALGDDARG
jgi:two-component system chemotaxis sensor kinase CheA